MKKEGWSLSRKADIKSMHDNVGYILCARLLIFVMELNKEKDRKMGLLRRCADCKIKKILII